MIKTTIVKIEGNKIQAIIDNDVKEFELEDWVKPDFVTLGEANLDIKDGKIAFCKMSTSKDFEKPAETTEKKTGNWVDDMTNFEDLLADAHKKFKDKLEIRTELLRDGEGNLQVSFVNKQAVFKAVVIADGETFEAHGDAEGITNDKITPHFMRMAETRAIARALRWATNNAKVAEEETSAPKGILEP